MSWTIPQEHAQWLTQGTDGVIVEPCHAMTAVRAYISRPKLDWIIVLASKQVGSGKSFAAAWLLERLQEYAQADPTSPAHPMMYAAKMRGSSCRAMWCDCASLSGLAGLKPWERTAEIDALSKCWALVLDDIGTEDDPGLVKTILTLRRAAGLLTICTTNLTDDDGQPMEEWSQRYGGRIASRMKVDGDHERGRRQAWCYCPTKDMRGRVLPELKPAEEEEEPEGGPVPFDVAAFVAPLVAATSPQVQVEAAEAVRAESFELAEAVRRKVRAVQLLEYTIEQAEKGHQWALDALTASRPPCTHTRGQDRCSSCGWENWDDG